MVNIKQDKRGFELAISTLIILVLGILVLIALSLAFTGGFDRFMDTITGYQASGVDFAVSQCDNACSAGQEFTFCCTEREVDFTGDGEKETITCKELIERELVECDIDCEGVC